MNEKENDLLKKLKKIFGIEAKERLEVISAGLLELEKNPAAQIQSEIIESIFREVHSLKGAARAVNMADVELLCHSIENVFAALKHKKIRFTTDIFDLLFNANDTIEKLIFTPEQGITTVMEIIRQLENLDLGLLPEQTIKPVAKSDLSPKASNTEAYTSPDMARISTTTLSLLLFQAEEMLSAKMALRHNTQNLIDVMSMLKMWQTEGTKVYPAIRNICRLVDKSSQSNEWEQAESVLTKILGFLEQNQDNLNEVESKVKKLVKSSKHDLWLFEGMVDNILDTAKSVLMLPFSLILEAFPKMVRDLSRVQGKEVELVLQGKEVEIDKRILDEIKDPLLHLIRNCIDHGAEKPEERAKKKKSHYATVTISISNSDNGKVNIVVSDDGAGIDLEKVKEAAVQRGVISENQNNKLTDEEILALIFKSEVSTSSIITNISGRGIGLAIAREKVEKLGGQISVSSELYSGTTFSIVLPISLATFRGTLVRTAGHLFIIPSANVDRVMRVKQDQIKTIENEKTIIVNERTVPLIRLDELLRLRSFEKKVKELDYCKAVVIRFAEKNIAFGVDEVLDETEVLVKNLGRQLVRVRNIAGAAVLGSGDVVAVLNVSDLIKYTFNFSAGFEKPATLSGDADSGRKSILVVEDSITARMLLKSILESAGYYVKTAIDGIDALTSLKTEEFDCIVSDVEMPRMDGFELTARVRADNSISHIPLVLVTALESREDREKGVDVGANAYIVKSSFDNSNLLEVVQRLI